MRSESFLFSSLCFPRVSKSVLLLEPKFGRKSPNFARAKHARFLGQGLSPVGLSPVRGPRAWRSFCGPVVTRPARSLPRALFIFGGPVVVSGRRAMFFVAAPWFSTSGNQKSGGRSVSLRLLGSLSTFAVETLLALHGAELPSAGGGCCNPAKRELEIIAEPLGLLHEALLSGSNFLAPCAQKLAATLCPCNMLLAACPFVLIAARRFLQFVTAPSCLRCVELRWCRSWPLVAGLGGWD